MGDLGRWWLAVTGAVGASPPLAPASVCFAALLVLLASLRRAEARTDARASVSVVAAVATGEGTASPVR